MPTTSLQKPSAVTRKQTDPLSVSTAQLPVGCELHRNGLTLPARLPVEEWSSIGRRVADLAGSAAWVIGDFLAYGIATYKDNIWNNRVPDGLYEKFSSQTGLSIQTLQNAKYVCSALPISRRREKLTFAHAAEIVGRAPEGQVDFWIAKAVDEGLSVKALREALRKSSAQHRDEPVDRGEPSFLEASRQYVRDYLASDPSSFTPAYRAELLRILEPVLRDLAPKG